MAQRSIKRPEEIQQSRVAYTGCGFLYIQNWINKLKKNYHPKVQITLEQIAVQADFNDKRVPVLYIFKCPPTYIVFKLTTR